MAVKYKVPFPWNGSKARQMSSLVPFLAHWSQNNPNSRWVEPFLGSGVVSKAVRDMFPLHKHILGDANPWLLEAHRTWLTAKCDPPTLADVQPERVQYFRTRKDSDLGSLSQRDVALRFMVCLMSAWGNRWATNKDGTFATPLNTGRGDDDPEYLLRRLQETYGISWLQDHDTVTCRDWLTTVDQAVAGDLVFLDSPYPETAGYGSVAWDLNAWSRMYCWVQDVAIPKGVNVLVCNPGTLRVLWDRVLKSNSTTFTPSQGRSSADRTEYVGASFEPNPVDLTLCFD